jgi:Tol biopolymer transport system component
MGGSLRPFPGRGRFLDMQLSPDRSKLLFMENSPGDPIFVGDAEGNNPEQIHIQQPGMHNHFPIWSADGRFVYFASGPTPTEMDVWRIPAGGGDAQRLTQQSSVGHLTRLDARTLLYTADREGGLGTGLWGLDVERGASFPVSSGIEAFTSVAADASGRRLVATVANPSRNLWTVPITGHSAGESEVKRLEVGSVHAGGPRLGPGYVVYISSRGGPNGLRKFENGTDVELWDGRSGLVAVPPAISSDGSLLCFAARRAQRWQLYVMAADGSGARPIAESLDVLGGPTLSPDGRWVAAVVAEGGATSLYKIPVDGGAPVRLVDSTDGVLSQPVWSPDGRMIVHRVSKGAQGSTYIRAVTPEGQPVSLPEIDVLTLGAAYRFMPDNSALVMMKGVGVSATSVRNTDFWLIELPSGETRQLTEMEPGYDTSTFDVSPDGSQIIFDRYRENSDIVLIDLPPAADP